MDRDQFVEGLSSILEQSGVSLQALREAAAGDMSMDSHSPGGACDNGHSDVSLDDASQSSSPRPRPPPPAQQQHHHRRDPVPLTPEYDDD